MSLSSFRSLLFGSQHPSPKSHYLKRYPTMHGEDLMLSLFERTLDLVCIVDKPGWFKKVNPAVIETLGYSEEELFSQPVSSRIHPEDKGITSLHRQRLLENEPLINFQNRYITKNGDVVWLQWTSVYIPEKEVVFAIAKNITKKKLVEIEIEKNYKKYKGLTTHFKDHIEKDRRIFASQLHEELAQLATVVKMDLEMISSQQNNLTDFTRERIEHGLTASQILIDKIRRLSYSIGAAQIEELGLDAVLKFICHEFSAMTGINCCYESNLEEDEIDAEIKLDLFRICQEALLNVMNHSQATQACIKVTQHDGQIELLIEDNGKGFEQNDIKSFGLKNMQGRAASINGQLNIQSIKDKGTKVVVKVVANRNGF